MEMLSLIGSLETESKDLLLGIAKKNPIEIMRSLFALVSLSEKIKSQLTKEQETSLFSDFDRHFYFIKIFLQKGDYEWMQSNTLDIIDRDIPSIKLAMPAIKQSVPEIGHSYFNVFDIDTNKNYALSLYKDLGNTNRFIEEAKTLIIEAETKLEHDPKSALQSLAEAMENACKAYCNNAGIKYEKLGLSLHWKMYQHWKSVYKDFWPRYQTGVRHIMQRCNLKKHHNYKPSSSEVAYLLLLAWEGFAEILDRMKTIPLEAKNEIVYLNKSQEKIL